MEKASQVISLGADVRLLGSRESMLQARVPVIAVCAVRTGSGKSQTPRRIAQILRDLGKKTLVVGHMGVEKYHLIYLLSSEQCREVFFRKYRDTFSL